MRRWPRLTPQVPDRIAPITGIVGPAKTDVHALRARIHPAERDAGHPAATACWSPSPT